MMMLSLLLRIALHPILYEEQKDKLKEILQNISERICFIGDVQTGCTIEGYIYGTIYVHNEWKFNSKILDLLIKKN